MRILITGANGQLGHELQRNAPQNVELHALDRRALDISDGDAVAKTVARIAPHIIINAAAYTAVDKAETDHDAACAINRDGAAHLARAAQAQRARLLHVSTDFVFDGQGCTPYLPGQTPSPLGVYGASKLAGEQAVQHSGADALIIRTAWVYAAHGHNFVKTMLRLMRERPEVRVVADQIGSPTAAASLARALWALIAKNAAAGIYHYTDAGVASWYDLAHAVREITQTLSGETLAPVYPIRTEDYPTPAQRPAYSVLDKTATTALIGPAPHWREALSEVLRELLQEE